MHRTRVLIIDDDARIRHFLQAVMVGEGFELLEASGGAEAIQIIKAKSPDLVLLDINMPGMDGIAVLETIRQWSHMPVIILSARSKVEGKTKLLDLGADDYMTKPFVAGEVLARIRAVLRRATADNLPPELPFFDDGYLRIEFGKRKVTVSGKEVTLTKLEYSILRELVANADRVIEYDQLLETIWGHDYQDARDSLKHCVKGLRRKIELDPEHPKYIVNLPQVGYRYFKHQS